VGWRWACHTQNRHRATPKMGGPQGARDRRGVAQGGLEGPLEPGQRASTEQDGWPAIGGPVTIEINTVRPLRWGACGVLKRPRRSLGRAKWAYQSQVNYERVPDGHGGPSCWQW
jgi:hypothetical protein